MKPKSNKSRQIKIVCFMNLSKLFKIFAYSTFVYALIPLSGFSQTMNWGIIGGITLSSPEQGNAMLGYHIGGSYDYSFKNKSTAYFNTKVLLKDKGWKSNSIVIQSNNEVNIYKWSARPYYLEIPIHFGYKWALSEKLKLFVDAGPYVAFGLWGRMKSENPEPGFEYLEESCIYRNSYHRIDLGLGVNAGAELNNHLHLSVGYDWGVIGAFKGALKTFNSMNRTFNASIGYMF